MELVDVKIRDYVFLIPCGNKTTVAQLAELALFEYEKSFPSSSPYKFSYVQDSNSRIVSSSLVFLNTGLEKNIKVVLDYTTQELNFKQPRDIVTVYRKWQAHAIRQIINYLERLRDGLYDPKPQSTVGRRTYKPSIEIIKLLIEMKYTIDETIQVLVVQCYVLLLQHIKDPSYIEIVVKESLILLDSTIFPNVILASLQCLSYAHNIGQNIEMEILNTKIEMLLNRFVDIQGDIIEIYNNFLVPYPSSKDRMSSPPDIIKYLTEESILGNPEPDGLDAVVAQPSQRPSNNPSEGKNIAGTQPSTMTEPNDIKTENRMTSRRIADSGPPNNSPSPQTKPLVDSLIQLPEQSLPPSSLSSGVGVETNGLGLGSVHSPMGPVFQDEKKELTGGHAQTGVHTLRRSQRLQLPSATIRSVSESSILLDKECQMINAMADIPSTTFSPTQNKPSVDGGHSPESLLKIISQLTSDRLVSLLVSEDLRCRRFAVEKLFQWLSRVQDTSFSSPRVNGSTTPAGSSGGNGERKALITTQPLQPQDPLSLLEEETGLSRTVSHATSISLALAIEAEEREKDISVTGTSQGLNLKSGNHSHGHSHSRSKNPSVMEIVINLLDCLKKSIHAQAKLPRRRRVSKEVNASDTGVTMSLATTQTNTNIAPASASRSSQRYSEPTARALLRTALHSPQTDISTIHKILECLQILVLYFPPVARIAFSKRCRLLVTLAHAEDLTMADTALSLLLFVIDEKFKQPIESRDKNHILKSSSTSTLEDTEASLGSKGLAPSILLEDWKTLDIIVDSESIHMFLDCKLDQLYKGLLFGLLYVLNLCNQEIINPSSVLSARIPSKLLPPTNNISRKNQTLNQQPDDKIAHQKTKPIHISPRIPLETLLIECDFHVVKRVIKAAFYKNKQIRFVALEIISTIVIYVNIRTFILSLPDFLEKFVTNILTALTQDVEVELIHTDEEYIDALTYMLKTIVNVCIDEQDSKRNYKMLMNLLSRYPAVLMKFQEICKSDEIIMFYMSFLEPSA